MMLSITESALVHRNFLFSPTRLPRLPSGTFIQQDSPRVYHKEKVIFLTRVQVRGKKNKIISSSNLEVKIQSIIDRNGVAYTVTSEARLGSNVGVCVSRIENVHGSYDHDSLTTKPKSHFNCVASLLEVCEQKAFENLLKKLS